jgi:hypothetical protein
MTLRAVDDPLELERRAAADPQAMAGLLESAKANGLISHRF